MRFDATHRTVKQRRVNPVVVGVVAAIAMFTL
jgi:hypothetical protein